MQSVVAPSSINRRVLLSTLAVLSAFSAAGCDGPANSTGCQLSIFICRSRRLETDDVSPVQRGPAGPQ